MTTVNFLIVFEDGTKLPFVSRTFEADVSHHRCCIQALRSYFQVPWHFDWNVSIIMANLELDRAYCGDTGKPVKPLVCCNHCAFRAFESQAICVYNVCRCTW